MAVVVESTASATNNGGSSLTITKPTGLAEGDLLVFVGSLYDSADTIDTKSGWTLEVSNTALSMEGNIQTKIADASDVAASNFTFTTSAAASALSGALLRVTSGAINELFSTDADSNGSPADTSVYSFSTTLSPTYDGALFIAIYSGKDGNSGAQTTGSYTCSDGTITWTELFDNGIDLGTADPSLSAAYGIQSSATALTTYGATLSGGKSDHLGTLAFIETTVDGNGAVASNTENWTSQGDATGTTVANTATCTENATAQNTDVETINPTVWTTTAKS